MLEGICMCFYKAIVQSMFKHVASEYAPLGLILQSYSQIFIVLKAHWLKFSRTDLDHQKLRNKFCFWLVNKAFSLTGHYLSVCCGR